MSDHVLIGKNGWLFLGEGTNSSLSHMTGRIKVPQTVQAQWRRAFALRAELFGDRVVNLVCPEKTCVYPEQLPDGHRVSDSRFVKFLEREGCVLYALSGERDTTDLYSRTDTHFTELGAHRVARRVCDELGIAYPELDPTWLRQPQLGDLGSALDPQVRSDNVIMANPPPLEVTGNGLRNRGRVDRYVQDATRAHILLFGDSFSGTTLAKQLAYLAGRVTFVHSLAFDYELIHRIDPDFVVGEMAERFLMEGPAEGRSLVATILEKKIQGLYTPSMLEEFTRTLPEFEDLYGPATAFLRRGLADS